MAPLLVYTLCTLALLGMLYGLWRWQLRRNEARHALEMARLEAARLQEINELKSRFIANLSHDFHTPLRLILASARRMWETAHDLQTRHDLGIVHKSAQKMSDLVDQLLDLSRCGCGGLREMVELEERERGRETPAVLPRGPGADQEELSGREEGLPDWLREGGGPVLLIVEENWDVRQYVRHDVEPYYHILEAADGVEGWKVATEEIPDIIISDVMLPKLDGFTLCRMLKEDDRTSHIPLVLLTAGTADQDRIEGPERWADDYVRKPFEPAELKARLLTLLERRRRLHEHFRRHGLSGIGTHKINPADERFLQTVVAVITDQLSDSALGVESLAEELAISRPVLLKKLQALVGEAPCELIRRVRLTTAAKLLDSDFGTISEIAMEVGFTNPSYFAECFEQQFGITPMHYHHATTV